MFFFPALPDEYERKPEETTMSHISNIIDNIGRIDLIVGWERTRRESASSQRDGFFF